MATASKSGYLLVSLAILALDQVTKEIVNRSLYLHETHIVIPNFFNIVHTRNSGAVFGFFQDPTSSVLPRLLMLLSCAALALVALFFHRSDPHERMNLFGLSLILGGAVGNIMDRVLRLSVVDFLEFYVGGFHWPAFNVADSAICVGIFFLVLRALKDPAEAPPSAESAAGEHP